MSNLKISPITIEQAKNLRAGYNITLKYDGTLMYYRDNKLISERGIVRNDRYKHILELLPKDVELIGEMYIPDVNYKHGNIFLTNSKKYWSEANFCIFELVNNKFLSERIKQLKEIIKNINSPKIHYPQEFSTIDEGWKFVTSSNSEGLVIRNAYGWYKSKLLKEAKIRIVKHEQGETKGTFILENGSRISGTSIGFVNKFEEIISKGNVAIAEIEYAFKTENGHYFQPRLRQIVEME